jgi:glutamate-5-semialdehyde dehydrogenase
MSDRLRTLRQGQPIVYGGDRVTEVPADLAGAFADGDRLIVVQDTGSLLHVPAAEQAVATEAIDLAAAAFVGLSECGDDQITTFFERFAANFVDDDGFAPIAAANAADVERAADRGRSTTRLELTARMREEMIAGLRLWRDSALVRDSLERRIEHDGWSVEARRAPLGVIGFVFEGRPNVFADAAGVVRTGNTVVFRIGSDALGTAQAIVAHALDPALSEAGLPAGTVSLVESAAHAAGWALFSDRRLSLAVARGSGPAVAQLGAVARQSGVPVSLHGTGGAWLVAGEAADPAEFGAAVRHSLDRKVCNTLNVCAIPRAGADELVPVFLDAVDAAAAARSATARVHVDFAAAAWVARSASIVDRAELGHEWEWENDPEVTLVVVDSVDEAIGLCNTHSPRFIASIVTVDAGEADRFYQAVDAPFVGNGFTRWVDGQYALLTPELGLSNWQHGRLLGRGGVVSGDSVHTVRYRAHITDPDTQR